MFTGIIEDTGKVNAIETEGSNVHFFISCGFIKELKIDQSVAHNGVCLTIVDISGESYKVTAIEETLSKTNLGLLKSGDDVNLERCMLNNGRFDGHIVQGHVDNTAKCIKKEQLDGSWVFGFDFGKSEHVVVEKGSVCVNGISLTCFNCTDSSFEVAIIPYTIEHTNLKHVEIDSVVNLEFDIIGKYVEKMMQK